MIGSLITRGLVMVFGYAYPAYECYKTVEKNKPEIEQLRFWCQYWILVAVLTVCERVGDAFISWVPMYSEAKLAFFLYLWYPKTQGTKYVYDSFFRPYIARHENEIDRNLSELRTRAGDMLVLYWQQAASYGQTRIYDVLQFVASQSTPRSRPQRQPDGSAASQLSAASDQPTRQISNSSERQAPPPTRQSSASSDRQNPLPTRQPSGGLDRQVSGTARQPSTPNRSRITSAPEKAESPSSSSSSSSLSIDAIDLSDDAVSPETSNAIVPASVEVSDTSAKVSDAVEQKKRAAEGPSREGENAKPQATEEERRVTRAGLRSRIVGSRK